MFESLASCFAFRCSAPLNSPLDESAVADMTARFVSELWALRRRLCARPRVALETLSAALFPVAF
jgi:hypothetical protein